MAAINAVTAEILYPEIISSTISAHSLDLTLYIAKDLSCFAGHFPQFHILPGVIQLSWAVHYAREFLALTAPVMQVERLKFTCPIQPNVQVTLHIDFNSENNSANFCFFSYKNNSSRSQITAREKLNFSQGRLIYGSADE